MVLSGGGARNATLVAAIHRSLRSVNASVELLTSAGLGWPVESIEPAAFAYLAWLRVRGQNGNMPATTGARAGVLCGQIAG